MLLRCHQWRCLCNGTVGSRTPLQPLPPAPVHVPGSLEPLCKQNITNAGPDTNPATIFQNVGIQSILVVLTGLIPILMCLVCLDQDPAPLCPNYNLGIRKMGYIFQNPAGYPMLLYSDYRWGSGYANLATLAISARISSSSSVMF